MATIEASDLLSALDIVSLRRVEYPKTSGGGLAASSAGPPGAFETLNPPSSRVSRWFPAITVDGGIDLEDVFPFLIPFLEDAERFWSGDALGDVRLLRSGWWTQTDASGVERDLEAIALRECVEGESAKECVLLIKLLGPEFGKTRGILQSAREQSLTVERLTKAEDALQEVKRGLELRVRERTTDLERANRVLLDYQRQLQSLVDQLNTAEESERRRVASFLHDDIGQSLASLKIQLGLLGREIADAEPRKRLDAIVDTIEGTIASTRSLTFDLGSPILYELGLASALENLAERVTEESGIAVRLVPDPDPAADEGREPLSGTVAIALYQSARELLHNAVKYSMSDRVEMSVQVDDIEAVLVVEDFGIGFDARKLEFRVTESGGFGLFSIRERLDRLGGCIGVASEPGRGTRVELRAPLRRLSPD